MRWRGETEKQREDRWQDGIRVFAIIPVQLDDGDWVWLEWYWSYLVKLPNLRRSYKRTLNRIDNDKNAGMKPCR